MEVRLTLVAVCVCGTAGACTRRPAVPPLSTPRAVLPTPSLPPYVVGALPPGSKAALQTAGIRLDRITHILPAPIFPDEKHMSGGTHGQSGRDGSGQQYGCAIDILPAPTSAQRRQEIRRLRLAGFASWSRGPAEPGGSAGQGEHYHLIWAGAATANRDQQQQLCSFTHGYRGVASSRVSRFWQRDTSIRADEIHAVQAHWQHHTPLRRIDACTPYEAMHRPFR